MEHQIFDPVKLIRLCLIPYIGLIHESKFTPGKIVRIQGSTLAVAYRFNIQLQCGAETVPQDAVAMRISVQLLDGYITINSLHNGIWDGEQCGTAMPIKRAENFEIILLCDQSEYKVLINGQYFYGFPQRIHYDHVTHLAIDGDVSIMKISYESAGKDEIVWSAPIAVSSKKKETDFKMVDTLLPPSYESVVYDNQRQSAEAQPLHTTSPYPVDASNASNSTMVVAYSSSDAPYPVQQGIFYYPSVPPPPPGPLVPLVAPKPVKPTCLKKCCGIFLVALGIILVVMGKIMMRARVHRVNKNN